MQAEFTFQTRYPEANPVLPRLFHDVQEALKEQLVGLYIHGSLASGHFTPPRSDIDFLVVTVSELPDLILPTLEKMHARITASGLPWAGILEGSYIPRDDLRHYDPGHAHHPALRVDGSFAVDGHGYDWIIQRQVLRTLGISLTGPALHTLIDPISREDILRATVGTLHEWWQPMLQDH